MTERLIQIINETTSEYRKGEVFEGTPELVAQAAAGEKLTSGGVLEIFLMPAASEADPRLTLIDVEFMIVGVDELEAVRQRPDLIRELNAYPEPGRLAQGPSYIEVGGVLGDQGLALRLFALGEAMGLWKVITPTALGFSGAEARDLAGRGFVMITGYEARP